MNEYTYLEKLLHKIEETAQLYGLKLNKKKCEILNTNPTIAEEVKFKDGVKVKEKTSVCPDNQTCIIASSSGALLLLAYACPHANHRRQFPAQC